MVHTMLYSEAFTYVILQLWRPGYWEWRDFRTASLPWWNSQRFSLMVLMLDMKAKSLLRKAYPSHYNTDGLSYTNEEYWHSNNHISRHKATFSLSFNTFCLDTLTWHIGSYQAFIFFISLFQLLYILLLPYNRWYRRKKARSEDTIIGGEVPPPAWHSELWGPKKKGKVDLTLNDRHAEPQFSWQILCYANRWCKAKWCKAKREVGAAPHQHSARSPNPELFLS